MRIGRRILAKLLTRAARSYVAGPHLSDAIGVAQAVAGEGLRSTIAYWNELGEAPELVFAAYQAAIDGAAAAGIDTYVSVKAHALSMSQDLTRALAVQCLDRRIGLHFDSHALEQQGETLDGIERLLPIGATLGCTLPSRFVRSLSDAERAVAQRLRVRVVKGQWEDPQQRVEPRRAFMAVIERLAGRAVHVAVATHDASLAEDALTVLAKHGTPAELELLFGLPFRDARAVARRLSVQVRVYVPYGYAWLPYALSAARRNPRVLAWILADAARVGTRRDRRSP